MNRKEYDLEFENGVLFLLNVDGKHKISEEERRVRR